MGVNTGTALVLRTNRAHPHAHLVMKADNEQDVRLNIKKAALRTLG